MLLGGGAAQAGEAGPHWAGGTNEAVLLPLRERGTGLPGIWDQPKE